MKLFVVNIVHIWYNVIILIESPRIASEPGRTYAPPVENITVPNYREVQV